MVRHASLVIHLARLVVDFNLINARLVTRMQFYPVEVANASNLTSLAKKGHAILAQITARFAQMRLLVQPARQVTV